MNSIHDNWEPLNRDNLNTYGRMKQRRHTALIHQSNILQHQVLFLLINLKMEKKKQFPWSHHYFFLLCLHIAAISSNWPAWFISPMEESLAKTPKASMGPAEYFLQPPQATNCQFSPAACIINAFNSGPWTKLVLDHASVIRKQMQTWASNPLLHYIITNKHPRASWFHSSSFSASVYWHACFTWYSSSEAPFSFLCLLSIRLFFPPFILNWTNVPSSQVKKTQV